MTVTCSISASETNGNTKDVLIKSEGSNFISIKINDETLYFSGEELLKAVENCKI